MDNLIDLGEILPPIIREQNHVKAFAVMKIEARQGCTACQVGMVSQRSGREMLQKKILPIS